ncbi:MFS transporter [Arcanobacterium canis]
MSSTTERSQDSATTTRPLSLWSTPGYRAWFAGDTSAKFAGGIRTFALPLAVVALTGSATQAGLIATTSQAIGVICMVPGGVIVDRFDRRKIIYLFAAMGTMIWGTITVLFATDHLTFPILIALTSLGAVNVGLFGFATDAVLRSIVRGENFIKAQAANRGRDASIELSAPPVGAAFYSLGVWVPFAVSVAGYLLLGLCGSLMKYDPPVREARTSPDITADVQRQKVLTAALTTFIVDIRQAWMWICAHNLILQIIVPFSVLNIGFMGVQFTYTYALVLHGRSPESIAVYTMSIAVFALVGSAFAGRYSTRVATGRTLTFGVPVAACFLVPTIFVFDYGVLIAGMGIFLFALIFIEGHSTIIFSAAPRDIQGRLMSLLGVITSLPLALSPTISGWMLDHVGYRPTITLFIFLTLIPALSWIAMPRVRSLPKPSQWDTVEL